MKKYLGLILLTALASSSVLAVKLSPDARQSGRNLSDSEVQIAQLDKRLSERTAEQMELLELAQKLLGMNFQQKTQDQAAAANVLSGQGKPPSVVAKPVAVATSKAVAPPVEQPWWQVYKPQMTYMSGKDRFAVINNKMYTLGQELIKGTVVEAIEDDAVVLRMGSESHTFALKK